MAAAAGRDLAAHQIRNTLERSRECLLEELVLACHDCTWNQVFAEVDRMSRTGAVLLKRSGPGVYVVSLPVASQEVSR